MSLIYLSKINFNSRIHDVYKGNIIINDILNEILENINSNNSYTKYINLKFKNNKGENEEKCITENYFFNNLQIDSEKGEVKGEVIRKYERLGQKFNEATQKMEYYVTEEASNIKFFFDVYSEYIAFRVRNTFGYNQFNHAFKYLLESCLPQYGFEVFLVKDRTKVEDAIKEFERINKITALIIPPNSNNDDIDNLDDDTKDYKEANITYARLEYGCSDKAENGLEMSAKVLQDVIKSVSNGYGDMNIHGEKNGRTQIFRSNSDGVVTGSIEQGCSDEEFINACIALIASIKGKS